MILVDLAPDFALAIPRRCRLAGGDLGDVDGHGSRVRDGRLGVVVECLAGGYVQDTGSPSAGVALIAPNGIAIDAGNGPVALEVLGGSDVLPVGRVANAGEGVCLPERQWVSGLDFLHNFQFVLSIVSPCFTDSHALHLYDL